MSLTTTRPPVDDWTRWSIEGELRATVSRAFKRTTQRETRDQLAFSMSALGKCRRASAYRIAGTPASEPTPTTLDEFEERRAAWGGTWWHRGIIPRMRELLRGYSERSVVLRVDGVPFVVPGRMDAWWPKHGGVLIDVKTLREYALDRIRATTARPDHVWQQNGYAAAARQAGIPVAWIATVYLDRATGAEEVVCRPFTEADEQAVHARVRELHALAADPDTAPRDEDGPGLSVVCDGCPWLRRCWGPDARRGDTSAIAVPADTPAPEVEAILADYSDASVAESEAKARKTAARAKLDQLPAGQYGDYKLGWGREKPGGALNLSATIEQLEGEGWSLEDVVLEAAHRLAVDPVLTRPRRGNISVRRTGATRTTGGS